MVIVASGWLAICAVLCLFAWFANRRFVAVSLPFAVAVTALAIYIPTGSPRYTPPPQGQYQILGADIQVNIAIYALLKPENGPAVFYRLPYSTSAANDLQKALDGAQNGQGVKANVDGQGGVAYDGDPPVSDNEVKTPEAPALTLP